MKGNRVSYKNQKLWSLSPKIGRGGGNGYDFRPICLRGGERGEEVPPPQNSPCDVITHDDVTHRKFNNFIFFNGGSPELWNKFPM